MNNKFLFIVLPFLFLIILRNDLLVLSKARKRIVSDERKQFEMEQKALEILEEKVNNQTVISGQPIGVLKSKVPVTAKVDELILDIERAEVISSSRLISVKFNDESVTGQDVQEKIAQTLGSEDSVEPEEESETEVKRIMLLQRQKTRK